MTGMDLTKSLLCAAILAAGLAACSTKPSDGLPAIANEYADRLDSIGQLIVVTTADYGMDTAALCRFEKNASGKWEEEGSAFIAYIGIKGFAPADQMREGGKRTPEGLFALRRMWAYSLPVETNLEVHLSTPEDKWIDDPDHKDYNRFVHGETDAKSFERMLLSGYWYKYCVVIEYNTDPVVPSAGSAIFFHLGDEPTSGCVTVAEEETMLEILAWLDIAKNPHILMGVDPSEPSQKAE